MWTLKFAAAIYLMCLHQTCGAPYRDVGGRSMAMKQPYTDCNVTITSSNGSISSPKHPNNYPDNSDCWFHLRTPTSGHRIQLQFQQFLLENSDQCTFDYLEIFDGSNIYADVLGRFCVTGPTNPIESSSNQLLLHFHSDYMLNSQGFRIQFHTITNNEFPSIPEKFASSSCPMVGDGSSGVITSPGYPSMYPANSNCSLVVKGDPQAQYILNFEDVHIEFDDLCLFDYVEIKDGANPDAPQLAQICGKKSGVQSVVTTGSSFWLQFISDGFVEFRGFKISYQNVAEEESEEVEEDEEEDEELLSVVFAEPFNRTVSKGQTQIIDCLKNESNSAIVWLKDHSFVSMTSEDDGIQLLPNNSLRIAYMTEDTEGIYTCVVLTERGAFSINFWIGFEDTSVDAQDPCGIEFLQKPKDSSVLEGENTFFTCFAKAEADLNVTWLKDGEVINKGGERIQILMDNVLLINRSHINDSGVYSCRVKLPNGCSADTEALLSVEQPHSQHSQIMCGKPNLPTRSGKVVAGRVAPKGSFPWQAMLWETWAGPFCGGSLIGSTWVLTAAHCFIEFQHQFSKQLQPSHLSIKLGKHDRSRSEADEQTLPTDKIIIHPKFNKQTYDNDIALVRLSHAVTFTDAVLPVCLADGQFAREHLYSTEIVGSVTGWGTLTEHGLPSMLLQEIRLPLVPFAVCANSTAYPVTSNMFCAGFTQRVMGDACHGDSGGPYTVHHQGRWYLLGIVSWGEGCDREGKYGFYTKVENYVAWIVATTNNVN